MYSKSDIIWGAAGSMPVAKSRVRKEDLVYADVYLDGGKTVRLGYPSEFRTKYGTLKYDTYEGPEGEEWGDEMVYSMEVNDERYNDEYGPVEMRFMADCDDEYGNGQDYRGITFNNGYGTSNEENAMTPAMLIDAAEYFVGEGLERLNDYYGGEVQKACPARKALGTDDYRQERTPVDKFCIRRQLNYESFYPVYYADRASFEADCQDLLARGWNQDCERDGDGLETRCFSKVN